MNRRNFTTSALGLFASAFGVANAKPNGDGITDDSLPLIRYTHFESDVGNMEYTVPRVVTLDGVALPDDNQIITIDERAGYAIKITNPLRRMRGFDLNTGRVGVDTKPWYDYPLRYKKVYGNYRITGLTRAEREAHLDLMAHRVVMDDPYRLEA